MKVNSDMLADVFLEVLSECVWKKVDGLRSLAMAVRGIYFNSCLLMRNESHEISQDLDICFDLHEVSSAGLRQPR